MKSVLERKGGSYDLKEANVNREERARKSEAMYILRSGDLLALGARCNEHGTDVGVLDGGG